MWRKKVDGTLLHQGTPIPGWVCEMWGITRDFSHCVSIKLEDSRVYISFEGQIFDGHITCSKRKSTDLYRLWYEFELGQLLQRVFVMSHLRDLEKRFRKVTSDQIESEIPFWEFIDIEYEVEEKRFYFDAYYKQKSMFPNVFNEIAKASILQEIDLFISDH